MTKQPRTEGVFFAVLDEMVGDREMYVVRRKKKGRIDRTKAGVVKVCDVPWDASETCRQMEKDAHAKAGQGTLFD